MTQLPMVGVKSVGPFRVLDGIFKQAPAEESQHSSADAHYHPNNLADIAYSSVMPKAFAILMTAAIMLQTLLGGLAAAGTVCLGGGHEHPADAPTQSCELDCSHASSPAALPALVQDSHADCGCVDIDFSLSDLQFAPPRLESAESLAVVPDFANPLQIAPVDSSAVRCLPPVPSWFDPGTRQRVNHLATTRLIL